MKKEFIAKPIKVTNFEKIIMVGKFTTFELPD
jgi:hypothetical protein